MDERTRQLEYKIMTITAGKERGMTREEKAIMYFKDMRKKFCEDYLLGIPKDSVAYKATMAEKEFYDTAIEVLKQEPKWIPVSDRLPQINEWVVCQCRANIYEILKFTSYGWYHDDAHCYMNGFVIAWMPLPEPYKVESEK